MPALDEKPELLESSLPFWIAFHDLSGSRKSGFAVGPIPVSEIAAYLGLIGVNDIEERLDYLRFIRVLDNTYLKHHAKEE